MAVELAQSVFVATRMQRLSRQTGVYVEGLSKGPDPLPVISAEGHPENSSQIGKVNFLLMGSYGLSLEYDELCKKAANASKKRRKGRAAYRLTDMERDIDDISLYSVHLSHVLSAYTQGGTDEEIEKSRAFIEEKSRAAFLRTFKAPFPPHKEKKIDAQLGVDRFLQSEVLGMGIEVHDIRTPLTTLKVKAQLLKKKGETEPDEALRTMVKERAHLGEKMRERLLSPVPVRPENVNRIVDVFRKFVSEDNVRQQLGRWNVILPQEPVTGFPEVPFNEHMFYSIIENVLTNAMKGRKLLEEYFGILLTTLFLGGESLPVKTKALRYLQRFHDRLEEMPTVSVDFAQVVLRRRQYTEIVMRDNGIGNDHRSGRRVWRRNFSMGDSNWSGSHDITGTGIAMGAHRQRIKELFPHTHADMFLRSRSDGQMGAEVVIRLPGERNISL